MRLQRLWNDERGVAMMVVLLVGLAVSAIALASAMVTTNSVLIQRNSERSVVLEDAAVAAVEEARSLLNGDTDLYPPDGYVALETDAPVVDASGTALTGLTRTIYVGPSGTVSGQFGVFGSIVSVVKDRVGNVAIRRLEVNQESFARYAYFTETEPSGIRFGAGDQIFGPVHSNSPIRIWSSGATFWDEVTTAEYVDGSQYATFAKGYAEYAARIPMPEVQDLIKLKTQALAGGTFFAGDNGGGVGQATTRVAFFAFDLNGDGDNTDADEGFIAVYRNNDARYVSADDNGDPQMQGSRNCGDDGPPHAGLFVSAGDHNPAVHGHDAWTSLRSPDRVCYLGGDPALNNMVWNPTLGPTGGPAGQWLQWPGVVDPRLVGVVPAGSESYLFPITRALNPNFKGVIFVEGKVAVSGTLRGRVTVVSTNDIIIVDDLTYATDPGAGTCSDIMGLTAVDDVIVSDNMINAPNNMNGQWRTMDDTPGEFVHGVILALDVFTVENHNVGATSQEPCEMTAWGRGCLYLSGGVIQRTRGAVGTGAGTGNLKRYSYDQCAYSNPPPYFPTTGHFARNRIYEIDPSGFDVAKLYALLSSN